MSVDSIQTLVFAISAQIKSLLDYEILQDAALFCCIRRRPEYCKTLIPFIPMLCYVLNIKIASHHYQTLLQYVDLYYGQLL